jgi:hypothetical protein
MTTVENTVHHMPAPKRPPSPSSSAAGVRDRVLPAAPVLAENLGRERASGSDVEFETIHAVGVTPLLEHSDERR